MSYIATGSNLINYRPAHEPTPDKQRSAGLSWTRGTGHHVITWREAKIIDTWQVQYSTLYMYCDCMCEES